MSCVILIPPPVLNPAAAAPALLLQAILDLRLIRREMQVIEDRQRQKHPIDYAVENAHGELIGIRARSGQPVEFVLPCEATASARQTVDRIAQAYSRLKVINEAKRQGYKVTGEERLPDGSVRLVVQKWH